MNIIISGNRSYTDYLHITSTLDEILPGIHNGQKIKVLTGHNNGVDGVVREFTNIRRIKSSVYTPLWDSYGRSAGPIRNSAMAKKADAAILFGSLDDPDIKYLFDACVKEDVPVQIIDMIPSSREVN